MVQIILSVVFILAAAAIAPVVARPTGGSPGSSPVPSPPSSPSSSTRSGSATPKPTRSGSLTPQPPDINVVQATPRPPPPAGMDDKSRSPSPMSLDAQPPEQKAPSPPHKHEEETLSPPVGPSGQKLPLDSTRTPMKPSDVLKIDTSVSTPAGKRKASEGETGDAPSKRRNLPQSSGSSRAGGSGPLTRSQTLADRNKGDKGNKGKNRA